MQSCPIAFRGSGGVALVGDACGRAIDAPVLLLHGGGQTRHAWGGTARALARAGYWVIALDHRGHGDSEWPADGDYNLATFAADVVEVTRQLERAPIVVGASLGGLAGLLAEGEQGPLLAALVLVDVAPRIERSGVEKIVAFMSRGVDGFASLEEASDAIAGYLPHRARRDPAGLTRVLRQFPDGRWRWHWDPRFIRREEADPAWSADRFFACARALTLPTLLVRGRMSDVISEESVREFREIVPHAAFADVAGAAHMVAGDDNDAFTSAVVDFLSGPTARRSTR